MPNPDVIAKIRQLHEALAAETRPDHPAVGDVRTQLEQVMLEPTYAPHYTGFREKLQAAYGAIETEHPRVAGAIQGVVQSLVAAGI